MERLAPVIREHADRGERERHLPDPVVEALQDAELYRMLVPRELGGLQLDPLTFYQVVEALARIDGSTGWCMFINGGEPTSAAFLSDEAAESIYGKNALSINTFVTAFAMGDGTSDYDITEVIRHMERAAGVEVRRKQGCDPEGSTEDGGRATGSEKRGEEFRG